MDILNPVVVHGSSILGDVVLEDDDVGVWNLLSVAGGENGSSFVVNGCHVDHGASSRQQGHEG